MSAFVGALVPVGNGEVWPDAGFDLEDLVDTIRDKETRKRLGARLAAARKRSVVEHDFPKLAQVVGELPIIKEAPPLIYHWRKRGHEQFFEGVKVAFRCHLMQSASDLFLGWTVGPAGRQFYVRQLKDMKIKMLVELFTRSVMTQYAELCGWTLAHARGAQPALIAGYLGSSDKFDEAIADFSIAYADQSERDHKILTKAVRGGRLEVVREQA
jgi:hypothetical protein